MITFKHVKTLAFGAALAVVAVSAIPDSANADPYYHNGRGRPVVVQRHPGWDRHVVEVRRYRQVYRLPPPRVVYAPPVVYSAPPQPTGFNLIFPLNIH